MPVPSCTINSEASPQFKTLCDRWRKEYPSIDSDLKDAFKAISQDIRANKGRRTQSGPNVEVYKYRQKSSDIRRGQAYGWRIYALYEKTSSTLYPIIVYPKTRWEDADHKTVIEAIKEIRLFLGHCIVADCPGTMKAMEPIEKVQIGDVSHVKVQCQMCRTTNWRPETDPEPDNQTGFVGKFD